jgi:5-methylcytosine-specific restriction endonuclease McrA
MSKSNYFNGRTLTQHYCLDCNKEIGCQALRCSSCNYKWMSENKINPGNYKDGSYLQKTCIDCGKHLVKKTAKRCSDCYKIILRKRLIDNPMMKGKKTSKETRIKQSISKLTYFGTLNEERKNPYVFDWNLIRKEIYKRDSWTCQECKIHCTDKGVTKIQCHHIDYNKHNNDTQNLITLCLGCHQPTNFNRDYWQKYFQEKMSTLVEKMEILL